METESLAKQVTYSKWIVFMAMLCAVGLYCYKFGWFRLMDSPEAWGQFGDFFGGLLNPIISAAAFYWLATSILLQKAELAETRDALRATQNAQQQHADTALITAKLNRANIRLSVIAARLNSLRARETQLWESSARTPAHYPTRGLDGELVPLTEAIRQVQEAVVKPEQEQQELLDEIDDLGNQLLPDVHETYSSHLWQDRRGR